jgi:hypothetical protein
MFLPLIKYTFSKMCPSTLYIYRFLDVSFYTLCRPLSEMCPRTLYVGRFESCLPTVYTIYKYVLSALHVRHFEKCLYVERFERQSSQFVPPPFLEMCLSNLHLHHIERCIFLQFAYATCRDVFKHVI